MARQRCLARRPFPQESHRAVSALGGERKLAVATGALPHGISDPKAAAVSTPLNQRA